MKKDFKSFEKSLTEGEKLMINQQLTVIGGFLPGGFDDQPGPPNEPTPPNPPPSPSPQPGFSGSGSGNIFMT